MVIILCRVRQWWFPDLNREFTYVVSVSLLRAFMVSQLAVFVAQWMGTLQSPHLKVMIFPRAIQLLQSDQFEMLNEWETFPQLNYSWHTYLEFVYSSEKEAVSSQLFLFPLKSEEACDQFRYSWCSRRPLIQQQFDNAFLFVLDCIKQRLAFVSVESVDVSAEVQWDLTVLQTTVSLCLM